MTRILGLDDEPEMVEILRLILERAGYEFIGTTNSQEALAILRTQPADLFIQDFMRPDRPNGWDLLRLMKSDPTLSDIPVLGVSAGPRKTRAEQLKGLGIDIDRDLEDYVQKPYGPMELLEAVEAVLKRTGKLIPPQAEAIRKLGAWKAPGEL
jgi:CheY-like chemotaxis protein